MPKHFTWQPPSHWLRIGTIEMHTGGEPLRILTSGLPHIEGRTVLEKRRHFKEQYDHIRRATMWEPRGHADMYGAVITPSLDADFDVFFLHNEGYSTMCGHAIIALTKLAFEMGLVQEHRDPPSVTFHAPAGCIHAQAAIRRGVVEKASFLNVPSFLYLRDEAVEVSGLGTVRFDVAYGGAYYAIVDASPVGLSLTAQNINLLVDLGRRIKHAVIAGFPIEHPFEKELGFLYGTIFTAPAEEPGHHSRNVCVFAEGEVDRSATGSGVSARAALHYARGELAFDEPITVESITGSTMTVRVVERTTFGPYDSVIPEVSGSAHFIGRNEIWIDPADVLGQGFLIR